MRTAFSCRAASRWSILVLASACGRSVVDPAPVVRPSVTVPAAAPAPAPVVVPVEVPAEAPVAAEEPGVVVRPFVPGRYAVAVHKTVRGTHHRNLYKEDTRASLVLTLADDGTVTGCRAIKSRSSHYTDRGLDNYAVDEQQGYRGRWSLEAGRVDLRLDLDDRGCASVRRHTNLAPKPWHLRCDSVAPEGHTRLGVPVLACRVQNRPELAHGEEYGLELSGIFAEPTVFLGSGNGVEIAWEADQVVPPEDAPVVKIEVAAKRIEVPAP